MSANFHLANGIFFRRDGEKVLVVRAKDFDDPGEVLLETDINSLASVVATFSPHKESNHSFQFVYNFLQHGTMFCGGCGARLTVESPGVGYLSVINLHACEACYQQKFKPLFDWGLERK